MNKFLPILLLAGAAIAVLAFRGRGSRQAPAPSQQARRRPQSPAPGPVVRQRIATTPAGCAGILAQPQPCQTGTCPLKNAQNAEISTFGDLARWVECAAGARGLSRAQIAKAILGSDDVIESLMAGNAAAWNRVRADADALVRQQGADALPGSAQIQYLGPDNQVRTVTVDRVPDTANLQLIYGAPLTSGWRQYPMFAAYGTAYWG